MPIPVSPITVTTEVVTEQDLVADKMHILKLTIADPTRIQPSIEIQMQPYAEDANGNKTFATEIVSYGTQNLYAALANLSADGKNGMATAMQAVFDATAELVQYVNDRKADLKAATDARDNAQVAYDNGLAKNDPDIATLKANLDTAQANCMKATSAYSDPANPKIVIGV